MMLHYYKVSDPTRTLYVTMYDDPMLAMEHIRTLMAGNREDIEGFQFTVEHIHDEDKWVQGGKPA
jgi:hypothetical protein